MLVISGFKCNISFWTWNKLMDDKRHLSQYGIHREESSHRAGCAAPLDEFFVKDKDGDMVQVVVEVDPIDFTSEFDVYIFVDNVQVYPLNDKPRYGHIPKPENDVRNIFPTIYHLRGFFGESEVRDEVDIYRDAPQEILSALKYLSFDLAYQTKETSNTIDVIVTLPGVAPNLPNLNPWQSNLATFSYHCIPISRIVQSLVDKFVPL